MNWEEDKINIPSLELGLHCTRQREMKTLNLLFLSRTMHISDSLVSDTQAPCTPPSCAGCSSRATGYFDHSRGQKLLVAEHRNQTLVLELINLVECM